MKKIETLLSEKGFSDKKNKLNRLNKKVNQSYLDTIESGVTLEDLDKMMSDGLPIFRYQTQITIHGIFNNLEQNYICGYKNLFQNKNKSIGVKYNAIDEDKRRFIAPRLRTLKFSYQRNSTSTKYHYQIPFDKTTMEEVRVKVKNLFASIDTSLFIGSKHVWIGDLWGQKYFVLELYINAIYEKNIEKFLNGMGATQEALDAKTAKDKADSDERQRVWDAEKLDRKKKKQALMEGIQPDIDKLAKIYGKTQNTQAPGIYLRPVFDYNDELKWKVTLLYLPEGKKKIRRATKSFVDIKEAVAYTPEPYFSDRIFEGSVSGFILK